MPRLRFLPFPVVCLLLSVAVTAQVPISELFPVKRLPDATEDRVFFQAHPKIAVDAAGNVYAINHLKHQVFKMNPQGILINELCKPGQGPGDIQFPLGIATDLKHLLIRDQNGFSCFDFSFNYITRFRQFTFLGDFAMAGENIVQFSPIETKMLTLITKKGEKRAAFADKRDGKYKLHVKTIPQSMVDLTINQSQVVTSKRYIYLVSQPFGDVWKYDFNGKLLWKKTIELSDSWLAKAREKNMKTCYVNGLKAVNNQGSVVQLTLFSGIACSEDDKIFLAPNSPQGKPAQDGIKLYQLNGDSLKLERILIIRNIPNKTTSFNVQNISIKKETREYHFYISMHEFTDDDEIYIGHFKTQQ